METYSLENFWAKICCVLYNLRMSRETDACGPGGFDPACYDPDFFQEYDMEYNEIITMHRNLTNSVFRYKELKVQKNGIQQEGFQKLEESLREDIINLVERTYAFIACAVRSKQSTESQVVSTLNQLGFTLPVTPLLPFDWRTVISFSGFVAITILLGVLAGTYIFPLYMDENLLKEAEYLGRGPITAIFWALCAIVFLSGAALSALGFRGNMIRRGKWRMPSPGDSKRSLGCYLLSSIIGGIVGYGFTIIFSAISIALISFFDNGNGLNLTSILKTFLIQIVWAIPAGVTAWFAVYHYDTPFRETSNPFKLRNMAIQMLTMGFISYLSAWAYADLWHYLETPGRLAEFYAVRMSFSAFSGVMMLLIGGYMAYWFPKRKYESLFKNLKIHCSYQHAPLPDGLPIYEDDNEVGKTGDWIKLFIKTYRFSIESEEFGKSKPFEIDTSKIKERAVEVPVQLA